MIRLMLALLSVFLFTTVSIAQEPAQHPIDKALEACIDKNGSTAGMVECTDKAYAAWDKELNKSYGELMRALKPGTKGSAQTGPARMDQASGFGFQVHRHRLRYDGWDHVYSDAH